MFRLFLLIEQIIRVLAITICALFLFGGLKERAVQLTTSRACWSKFYGHDRCNWYKPHEFCRTHGRYVSMDESGEDLREEEANEERERREGEREERNEKKRTTERFLSHWTSGRLIFVILCFEIWVQPWFISVEMILLQTSSCASSRICSLLPLVSSPCVSISFDPPPSVSRMYAYRILLLPPNFSSPLTSGPVSTSLALRPAHKYKSYIIDSKANVGESFCDQWKVVIRAEPRAEAASRRLLDRPMKA